MEPKKPTHDVFVVIDPPTTDAKARWTKIGVGFSRENGMTVLLDAVPLNARLVVRPARSAATLKGGPK